MFDDDIFINDDYDDEFDQPFIPMRALAEDRILIPRVNNF
jgi:hypothetical protein